MKATILMCILGMTACSAAPEAPEAEMTCGDIQIQGERASLTSEGSKIDGVAVGTAQTCDEPGAFVRLQGDGWRTIVMGRGDVDGLAGCSVEAVLAGPAEGCPKVQFDALGTTLAERIKKRGAVTTGVGLGVCGDMRGGFEDWNPSISVNDWSHADIAIEELAGLLKELKIKNGMGVSVRPIPCAIPL